MTFHVLPGDSLAEEFKKTKIKGDIIVCRECLMVGPANADDSFEFWNERARFILAEYGEDEIVYHERVADELEQLRDVDEGTEVNLWFEYELFCSVNLWFCLSLLSETGADVYRVEPVTLDPVDRWKGFGQLAKADLKESFAKRKRLSEEEISLGSNLWDAFRKRDGERLKTLAENAPDTFPHLAEVCAAAAVIDTTPTAVLRDIRSKGTTDPAEIFVEFSKRAGVYGFGDLQVQGLLDGLTDGPV